MNIFVANEQDLAVDEVRLSVLARHTLASEEIDDGAELSVLLVNPAHIRRLNARFAGDDYPTDVLAFPMMEEDEDTMVLGDVVMCPQVARANARKLGHSLDRELETLCVHGILHLLGYDHQGIEDGARMEQRVEEVLSSFDPQRV
ncbi:MAG TPA: rRNA maturation RNase YbeY [Actinomycetota bacterium]|jgi:probable rRNA maturation factor|nr:rRNA maturation RNase YbeY [Actinomycetota bacterium]